LVVLTGAWAWVSPLCAHVSIHMVSFQLPLGLLLRFVWLDLRKRGISSNGGGCVSRLGYRKSLRYVRSATSNQDFVWVEAVRRHNAMK